METLDASGVTGPYEAVLPPSTYYAYLQATEEGADVHRSVVMREYGAVFSMRGGDFLTCPSAIGCTIARRSISSVSRRSPRKR